MAQLELWLLTQPMLDVRGRKLTFGCKHCRVHNPW